MTSQASSVSSDAWTVRSDVSVISVSEEEDVDTDQTSCLEDLSVQSADEHSMEPEEDDDDDDLEDLDHCDDPEEDQADNPYADRLGFVGYPLFAEDRFLGPSSATSHIKTDTTIDLTRDEPSYGPSSTALDDAASGQGRRRKRRMPSSWQTLGPQQDENDEADDGRRPAAPLIDLTSPTSSAGPSSRGPLGRLVRPTISSAHANASQWASESRRLGRPILATSSGRPLPFGRRLPSAYAQYLVHARQSAVPETGPMSFASRRHRLASESAAADASRVFFVPSAMQQQQLSGVAARIQQQRVELLQDILANIGAGPYERIDQDVLAALLPASLQHAHGLGLDGHAEASWTDDEHQLDTGAPFEGDNSSRLSRRDIERLLRSPPEHLSYETLLQISDFLGDVKSKAASEEAIDALPTLLYGAKQDALQHGLSLVASQHDKRCSICLSEFDELERIKEMPCSHYFHVQCLDTWLKSNASCPICRSPCSPSPSLS